DIERFLRMRVDDAPYVVEGFDRLALDLDEHVARLQPHLLGGALRDDAAHDGRHERPRPEIAEGRLVAALVDQHTHANIDLDAAPLPVALDDDRDALAGPQPDRLHHFFETLDVAPGDLHDPVAGAKSRLLGRPAGRDRTNDRRAEGLARGGEQDAE